MGMEATDFDFQADVGFELDTDMDLRTSGPVSKGKGDDHGERKIQPPAAWGDEARPYLDALDGLLG